MLEEIQIDGNKVYIYLIKINYNFYSEWDIWWILLF